MVAHLAVGQDGEVETVACFGEQCQLGQAIAVCAEDGGAPVSTRRNVIAGVVEFDAQRSIHGPSLGPASGQDFASAQEMADCRS